MRASLLRRCPSLAARPSILESSINNVNAHSKSSETASSSKSHEGLQLSPEFVERMLELRKKQGKENFLRVSVEGGGCSGMQYKYDLVDDIADDDKVFTRDGVSAIVDPVSLPYMNGAVLTFEDQLIGGTGRSAFTVIDNPNIESSCGCNVSFSPLQL
eukprot:g35085.t1